ncbi:MAG TPA: R2-like ligand-binding oxidase [Actinomycetota bacterium]|nr:R2-like ligand-binding oxidase [Actinomycetota bacterium]
MTISPPHRAYTDWASPKGFRTDILPYRLWERARRLAWDPSDIDFSSDAADWASLPAEHRFMIAGLARGFMIGEESVTLDIMPLAIAVADEGRVEEAMYLTTFAYEEANHTDLFRRWFNAIGFDIEEMDSAFRARAEAAGLPIPAPDEPRTAMFESELPRVMRRLLVDRSPEAFLDAGVTYNQFVEGCLAISGYRLWSQMFEQFGVLSGLREGLTYVQRDERRHIAYGTYLCRRIIAAHPELFEFARTRMYELRDFYFDTQFPVLTAARAVGNTEIAGSASAAVGPFQQQTMIQVERRVAVLERARSLSVEEAERGTGAEEAEVELEHA